VGPKIDIMTISRVCSTVARGCFLLAALLLVSCSHPHNEATADNISRRTVYLTPNRAARLAAELANDECERRFHQRPFRPEQHAAVLQNGEYQWGGLDVGGPRGYSALVTLGTDGTHPKVEVYFSTDTL
jgi:hypothetical protein